MRNLHNSAWWREWTAQNDEAMGAESIWQAIIASLAATESALARSETTLFEAQQALIIEGLARDEANRDCEWMLKRFKELELSMRDRERDAFMRGELMAWAGAGFDIREFLKEANRLFPGYCPAKVVNGGKT